MTGQLARRVTIYRDAERGWLFKVQGQNWHTIYRSPVGFTSRRAVEKHVGKHYPDVELVVST